MSPVLLKATGDVASTFVVSEESGMGVDRVVWLSVEEGTPGDIVLGGSRDGTEESG